MAGEPDWRVWALWLALQLHLALGRGARPEDREAACRAVDDFQY
jgi:hypothetical protein